MIFNFNCGECVEDSVTGIVGEITARCDYAHTPPQYLVEWADKSGFLNGKWLDEERLSSMEIPNGE